MPGVNMFVLLFAICSVDGASLRLQEKEKCPVTRVNAFQGNSHLCGDVGILQSPSVIQQQNTSNLESCAGLCLDNSSCKSFSYQGVTEYDQPGTCITYNEFLEKQGFQDDHFQNDGYYTQGDGPGYGNVTNVAHYDRNCYSTDCKIIDACAISCGATNGFPDSSVEGFYIDPGSNDFRFTEYTSLYGAPGTFDYEMYACGVGMTARKVGGMRKKTLDGNLTNCDAIQECLDFAESMPTRPLGYTDYTRSMNVYYYIPSAKWICKAYKDERPEYGQNTHSETLYTTGTHTGHFRFNQIDANVGASYAYYPWAYDVEPASSE